MLSKSDLIKISQVIFITGIVVGAGILVYSVFTELIESVITEMYYALP